MSEKNSKGTPTDLSGNAVKEISSTLRRLLADVFALYVKTKNSAGGNRESAAR
jgi:starvation-inducible DNA-binding protein